MCQTSAACFYSAPLLFRDGTHSVNWPLNMDSMIEEKYLFSKYFVNIFLHTTLDKANFFLLIFFYMTSGFLKLMAILIPRAISPYREE
jgi:hypothetical protein